MKKLCALIITIAAIIMGYIYYSPYSAIKALSEAAQAGNSEQVSKYIDSASLKADLSSQFHTILTKEIIDSPELKDNPFSALAFGMIAPMVETASTVMSSPQGLTKILSGQNPFENTKDSQSNSNVLKNPLTSIDVETKSSAPPLS